MSDTLKDDGKPKVTLSSFGYKYGIPADSNTVWDVRFLPNPYWEEELRQMTGLEKDISDYVVGSSEGRSFLKLLKTMVIFMVQQNISAGKKEIQLAVGCTGGRHRSVAIAEVLKDLLMMLPVELKVNHRDIEKDVSS